MTTSYKHTHRGALLRFFGIMLVLIGAVFGIAGSWLVILGASLHYLLAGAALIIFGVLILLQHRRRHQRSGEFGDN